MNRSQIFTIARRHRGIGMSLALRQVYAALRCCGMRQSSRGRVVSHKVDLGEWLSFMTSKRAFALADYGIPVA